VADGEEILPGGTRALALADLETLDRCAAAVATGGAAPAHPGLLQRLRTLHLLAVDDEDQLAPAWSAHGALEATVWGRTPEGQAVTGAFAGALHALEGRHGFWPHRRIGDLRRGLELLDRQVAERPGQLEVRYLRLVSTAFLPSILGRGESVQADLEVVAELLPPAADTLPRRTWTAMADAVEALLLDRAPELATRTAADFRQARSVAAAADLPLAPGCRVG
jgi:hypothetical protein